MTKAENSYQEDNEIETVWDTPMDKKNAEKLDENFSKMTLKGQMKSTLYSTEEEVEEPTVHSAQCNFETHG